VVHTRPASTAGEHVVWLASPDYRGLFVIVLLPGRRLVKSPAASENEHLGFAVTSVQEVKRLAERGRQEGILFWDYEEGDYPVGTTCGVLDPDGNVVEFSFGQPIGFDHRDQRS
jgi:catechol 2,3-dioxygenase-like lactoylglutathione lyase family enzyme